jgi:1-acyl-sn-glycerol-3-phosphate acyltransferase
MVLMAVATIIWSFACLLSAPFPYAQRYWWTSRWNVFVIWAARVICGIRYEIRGMENLPDAPAILLSKHQSAWETIFYVINMPRPLVFVFKKELTYIPFFGWAWPAAHDPDRPQEGRDAFPRCWSMAAPPARWPVDHHVPGRHAHRSRLAGQVQGGGTRLAVETGALVVPVAMNSGECWPKGSFIKKPGLITVSIGKPISPEGLNPQELNERVENWIESEMRVISPDVYKNSAPRPAARCFQRCCAASILSPLHQDAATALILLRKPKPNPDQLSLQLDLFAAPATALRRRPNSARRCLRRRYSHRRSSRPIRWCMPRPPPLIAPPPATGQPLLPPPSGRPADGKRRIQLGEHTIDFALLRSKRRTIGFLVSDEGLRVTAPKWVTLAEIDNAIREKQRWILTKLNERRERRRAACNRRCNGATAPPCPTWAATSPAHPHRPAPGGVPR